MHRLLWLKDFSQEKSIFSSENTTLSSVNFEWHSMLVSLDCTDDTKYVISSSNHICIVFFLSEVVEFWVMSAGSGQPVLYMLWHFKWQNSQKSIHLSKQNYFSKFIWRLHEASGQNLSNLFSLILVIPLFCQSSHCSLALNLSTSTQRGDFILKMKLY